MKIGRNYKLPKKSADSKSTTEAQWPTFGDLDWLAATQSTIRNTKTKESSHQQRQSKETLRILTSLRSKMLQTLQAR